MHHCNSWLAAGRVPRTLLIKKKKHTFAAPTPTSHPDTPSSGVLSPTRPGDLQLHLPLASAFSMAPLTVSSCSNDSARLECWAYVGFSRQNWSQVGKRRWSAFTITYMCAKCYFLCSQTTSCGRPQRLDVIRAKVTRSPKRGQKLCLLKR